MNKAKRVSSIGGQALMEGVMMQGVYSSAMAVRTSEGDIIIETRRCDNKKWYRKVPILRGIIAFVLSLINGVRTLMRSSEVIFPDEETPSKFSMTVASILGVVLAVGLFILLPSFLTSLLGKWVNLSILVSSLIEGLIRIVLFVLYLLIVSRMKDIKRTFMYHGAEHRTINCYEHELDLTVENVQKCSTRHNRCGTTFLFFVMVVSILVFSLTTYFFSLGGIEFNTFSRMGVRLLLLPIVAGLSYELLKFLAFLPDNWFVNILRAPGLALQRLTTYPPLDEMAEVGIASFLAVKEMDEDRTIPIRKFGEFFIIDVQKEVAEIYKDTNIEECEVDWLICEVLNLKRSELAPRKIITLDQKRKIINLAKKRVEGIPLDYLTNKSYFYGNTLYVDENVLIPRMETELLCEKAIELIGKDTNKTVLDLCTGSGCIALAISKNTTAKITASDLSYQAISVAKQNLAGTDVEIILSDMFNALTDRKFDVIISNPPYINSDVIQSLEPEVTHQPKMALDGGEDGLDFYRIIAQNAKEHLNENGVILLEIGYDQGEKVKELFKDSFDVEIMKDLQGQDRIVIAKNLKI